ncbi:hypothetical protein G3R49_06695 [Shewanella sp. WXL01]|uniref:FimV/HubP family polar landmark protein n=1 Tax=Shewanella sp. WXL01 TaxID=2709721 RepID=UPI00143833F8|nr:FimV/HubP family polar landmark protein [Shewanella sp. WXL01]NKF50260.1 hypothetical protein [Shewanella sp. WXL01]
MTFRTSNVAKLLAIVSLGLSATTIALPTHADSLKITGPNGEVKQAEVRQYGPTTSSDTFWSIAQKVRPNPNISVYQVMSALFDANPHAFSGNNYNTLEKDMVLMIPSADVMAAIPKAQAKRRAELEDQRAAQIRQTSQPQTAANQATASQTSVNQTNVNQPSAQQSASSQASQSQPNKPRSSAKPLQIVNQPAEAVPVVESQVAANDELARVNSELDAEHSKNLMLTDELARAQDQLMVAQNDNLALKNRIDEMSSSIGALEEQLQILREKHQALTVEHDALLESTKEPAVVQEPPSTWRKLMDNMWLLVLLAALPLVLIFGLVFWLLNRKKKQQVQAEQAQEAEQVDTVADETTLAEVSPEEDDLSELAIHLDDDEEESIDDLLDLDNVEMQPEADLGAEADIVLEEQSEVEQVDEDDTTSLDDLWAEAMEEQDQELGPLEDDEASVDDVDNLDNLLDGIEDTQESELPPESEEDMEDLLAEFDLPEQELEAEPGPESVKGDDSANVDNETAQDDIDSLLADLDVPETDEAPEQTSAEATSAEAEEPEDLNVEDVDALLAELDMPAEPEPEPEPEPVDDIDQLLESIEQEAEQQDVQQDEALVADDDVDSLLASLQDDVQEPLADQEPLAEQEPSADQQPSAEQDPEEELPSTEEIDTGELLESNEADLGEELEQELEQAAELETELDSIGADQEQIEDVDALLAELEAPVAPETSDTPVLDEAIAKELDAELEELNEQENVADDDIDALLANLDADSTESTNSASDADELAAELGLDEELHDDSEHQEATDEELDAMLADLAGTGSDAASEQGDAVGEEPSQLASNDDLLAPPSAENEQELDHTSDELDEMLASLAEQEAQTDEAQDEAQQDLDSLLGSLSNEADAAEQTSALNDQDDARAQELDSLLAGFDTDQLDSEQPDSDPLETDALEADALETNSDELSLTLDDSNLPEIELEPEASADLPVNDDAAAQELEALLANMGNDEVEDVADAVAERPVQKDSGFFDDLKAGDKADANAIDWETDLFNQAQMDSLTSEGADKAPLDEKPLDKKPEPANEQSLDYTDDDLLAAFSESLSDDERDTLSSEDEFFIQDDKLTVDEALAALDEPKASDAISNDDLTSFERENDFIDIDKLLSDADEETEQVDQYKDVDVDVGEVDSLIGNAEMVDVDDEENSVNAKLDLARAYIEIEDKDSAIALLKEVQIDGNQRQQDEATNLISTIE